VLVAAANNPETLFGTEDIVLLFDPSSVLYFVVCLVVLAVAKVVNDRLTPYALNEELTEKDNKAIALSFAGYLFAVILITWSVMGSDTAVGEGSEDFVWLDLGSTLLWSLIGVILLQVSRVVNNRLLLPRFNNVKELVEDRNVGTGAVQAGTYIGTALMIRPVVTGEGSGNLLADLGLTLIYFVLAQLAFIVFGIIYQRMSAFDLHDEIERDNASAGIGFGLTLVAVALLLSGYLLNYDSLLGFLVWFFLGAILLVAGRKAVDRILLPGSKLDDEIKDDRNWGAALIEGAVAIGLALILVTSFAPVL